MDAKKILVSAVFCHDLDVEGRLGSENIVGVCFTTVSCAILLVTVLLKPLKKGGFR